MRSSGSRLVEKMMSSSKGMLKLLPVWSLRIVDAAFEWHDPAIEQVGGADELTAEVVDDEAAAEGLYVQGRLVIVAVGVIAEVEHIERELAAGDDERPAARNPAGIVFFAADDGEAVVLSNRGDVERDVDAGVVNADDLALDDDRVGDVDDVVEDARRRMATVVLPLPGGP